jgi:hypothetical protein
MKIGTVVKLGSLAFGVVRDEKVQELFKMAHSGARRRGLLQPPQAPQATWSQSANRKR